MRSKNFRVLQSMRKFRLTVSSRTAPSVGWSSSRTPFDSGRCDALDTFGAWNGSAAACSGGVLQFDPNNIDT
jgi:hypothetical protein